MPDPPGRFEGLAAEILSRDPTVAVVFATGRTDSGELLDAVQSGAGGPVRRTRGRFLERDDALAGLRSLIEELPTEPSWRDVTDGLDDGTLLLVDDAQWLDEPTLRVLAGLADHADEHGVGVVVCRQPVPLEDKVAALDVALTRWGGHFRVQPLDEQELAERVAGRLGSPASDDLVGVLKAETFGLTGLVDPLLDSWVETGVVEGGRLLGPPPPSSETFRTTIQSVADGLPAEQRRLLVALSVGVAAGDDVVAELAQLDGRDLGPAVEALRAAGLVLPDHDEVVPIVAEAVRSFTPAPERRRLHAEAAEALVARAVPPSRIAGHLVEAEATGPEPAALLLAAGDEVVGEAPQLAAEWYERAQAIGADPAAVSARRAEAALLGGDNEAALRQADEALAAAAEGADRARALGTVAVVLAERALWHRAAESFLAVSGHPRLPDGHWQLLAVPALVATGDAQRAAEVARGAEQELRRPAPVATEVAMLSARGLLLAIGDEPGGALDLLVEAAELAETGLFALSETPHALAALVATAACDFTTAARLIDRARAGEVGGAGAKDGHLALAGWVALRSGRWADAEAALASLRDHSVSSRVEVYALGLEAGLARRAGDVPRLVSTWERAEGVVLRSAQDLLAIEPLAELVVCGARLERDELIGARSADLERLIADLGGAPLWDVLVRWHLLLAAVTTDDPEGVATRAAAVAALPAPVDRLDCLRDAAACWARLMEGKVSEDEVTAATEGLASAGLVWEASRLAGHAAIRVTDSQRARALLELARNTRAALPSSGPEALAAATALSEREQEIGAYVADGLTYKEIGAQLYISPKTVEHHVARVRQKLGASTRAEMLAALRDLLT